MDPSGRIRIISEIADLLGCEEWALIDLTLRQFGLPSTEQWDGTARAYVMSMIEDADDDLLWNLAEHLHLRPPLPDLTNNSKKVSVPTSTVKELIKDVELQKGLMISVATGGPRIQQVNEAYKDRRLQIMSVLQEMGIQDPNPFGDLWNWYGKWSDGSLPTYQSRRKYITELFQALIDNLMLLTQRKSIERVEPTGWVRVDRNVEKIIHLLESAANEEDFQAVGLLCREAIISLAQAVYNPELHQSLDDINPSETDAKRMLESYISSELAGSSNEELRKYAKNAYQLAIVLQHKRTASFREAALCVEANRSLINIVAIISGRRDP